MKKLLFAVLLCAIGSAQATMFNFSMSGGTDVISGSFDGTANNNLISNLSNISVAINGVAFNGSGNLFSAQYDIDIYQFVPGAVASFDGTENNFLFINSDFVGGDTSFNAYMYSINSVSETYVHDAAQNYDQALSGSPTLYDWQVSAANAVPEPASIALFGLGLAGLGVMRRRNK